MNKKSFRKLKRLELVELIYQLRKDNLEWRKRCKTLEKQLRKAEKMAEEYASHSNDEQLIRIEKMLADIQRARQPEPADEAEWPENFEDVTWEEILGESAQPEAQEPENDADADEEAQPEEDSEGGEEAEENETIQE